MQDTRVFMLLTVTVGANRREFNAAWTKESLPYWERYCRHIGSFTANPYAGGPSNQIVRLFEFESLERWTEWQKWLHFTPEGTALRTSLARFDIVVEAKLMAPAPV
ncbi:MAG: hypothetical protein QM586_02945 [Xenophilus sp.]